MNTTAKYTQADQAIAAYDYFIRTSAGRPFDSAHADLLAMDAAEACDVAARDRTVNQATRDIYRAKAVEFHGIYA